MFRWLNGPGAAFRDPLPGSTNYLNAYDPQGNLIRARGSRAPGRDPGRNGSENETKEQNENGLEPATGRIGFEQNIAGGRPIPKEQADDLIPFPMNRQFRSQPVLSEELRDEIYRRITKESKSVRRVSAELGVEMNRVGAVFRLKTIEHQWRQEVRQIPVPMRGIRRTSNDETKNNSISLEDFHRGY